MEVTAHRGFGDRYPQNTVGAARAAADVADAVEVDVRRCGSGDLVASHFDRLRWSTDSTGRVGDLAADELARLSVDGSEYGVPRLGEVLDVVPPGVRIEVDLKEPGVAEDVIDAVDAAENDVIVSSFYSDSLWEVRSLDESVALAYNFDVRLDRNLTTADLVDCERANVHWSMCLATDAVGRARSEGLSVHAWPVSSRLIARALGWTGVDGVVATSPRAARWARRGEGGSLSRPAGKSRSRSSSCPQPQEPRPGRR